MMKIIKVYHQIRIIKGYNYLIIMTTIRTRRVVRGRGTQGRILPRLADIALVLKCKI